jgi:hypothetical protein
VIVVLCGRLVEATAEQANAGYAVNTVGPTLLATVTVPHLINSSGSNNFAGDEAGCRFRQLLRDQSRRQQVGRNIGTFIAGLSTRCTQVISTFQTSQAGCDRGRSHRHQIKADLLTFLRS